MESAENIYWNQQQQEISFWMREFWIRQKKVQNHVVLYIYYFNEMAMKIYYLADQLKSSLRLN